VKKFFSYNIRERLEENKMEEDFLDIYEIRAKIDDLEESLLLAYDNGNEDEIQSLKSQLEIVKEQEETLMKSR
jgi:predicted  nucleic acid-binding Zn-ribbon protein